MIDSSLLFCGTILMIVAGLFVIAYMVVERGSILDPMTVSWAGYLVCVAGAMVATAILYPMRGRDSVKGAAMLGMVIALFGYVVGLYATRGKWLANRLPVPRPTLNMAEIWFMWLASVTVLALSVGVGRYMPLNMANVSKGIFDGAVGAATLLSVMVLIGHRGQWGTKIIMLLTLAGAFAVVMLMYFSRRPLTGIVVAAGAYFYRTHIMKRNILSRSMFLGTLGAGAFLVILFVGATRGNRFYGEAAGRVYGVFSSQNYLGFLGGLTINYEAFEFSMEQFPDNHDFMWGAGFVPAFTFLIPRAIWPEKPIASGALVTELWYHTKKSETNIACTDVGEWYVNFGFPGLLFGPMVIGLLVRAFNTYMRQNWDNKILWPAWLLIIPDFASEWRGDFTSMTVQPLTRVSIFLFISFLASKFVSSKQIAPQPAAPARNVRAGRGAPAIAAPGRLPPRRLPIVRGP